MKRICIFTLLVWQLVVVCLLVTSSLALAGPQLVYTDEWLNQRYDWVFYVEPQPAEHILDYPGSGLRPVSKMKVAYRINPRLTPGKPSKAVEYEDLYFSRAIAIGCKRLSTLPFQEGWQGAISVQPGKVRDVDHGALANTIARLAVDAIAKKCVPVMVLVPPDMVTPVASEMKRFNFVRTGESSFGDPTGLFLVISSGADEDRQFVMFKRR